MPRETRTVHAPRHVALEQCEWCHWEYPATQMILTVGRRLCVGCNAVYYADDEDEDEKEED